MCAIPMQANITNISTSIVNFSKLVIPLRVVFALVRNCLPLRSFPQATKHDRSGRTPLLGVILGDLWILA